MACRIRFCGDWRPREGFYVPATWPKGEVRIGNLECAPFIANKVGPEKAYPVFIDKEDLEPLNQGAFCALSLANNHVGDAGEEGVDLLLRYLSKFPRLKVFGLRDRPYVCFGDIAIVGCLEKCASRSPRIFPEEEVHVILRKLVKGGKKVIVFPHWGKESEYTFWATPNQRKRAAEWIRAGASAVIGHHPHCIQGRQILLESRVWYSLGNFHFPQEQSDSYSVTKIGMTLLCSSRNGNLEWSEEFHENLGDRIAPIQGERLKKCQELFSVLSRGQSQKNWIRWSEYAGSIYLKKSAASWRLRLKRDFPRAFPRWIAWNCLPKVVLIRLVCLFFGSKGESNLERLTWM